MPVIEFAAQSSRDPDSQYASTARLLNCYREPVADGRFIVKSVPGMNPVADTGLPYCRAMATVEGVLYLVQGGVLHRIGKNGTAVALAEVPDSPETTISSNNGLITMVADGRYFTWDGETLAEPAPGAFDAFGSVTFIGQLTVLTEKGGRRVQWSGVADASTLGGLDFATTESRDDDILRALPIGGGIWFFKTGSLEQWYQTGEGLAVVPGSTRDVGLKAFGLLSPIRDGAFFVGADNVVYLVRDGAMQAISTPPVSTSIATQAPDRTFYYEDEAHKFCVVTFTDRPAWVFDVATLEWHERAEGEALGPWFAEAAAEAYGKHHVGTARGGVFTLERINRDGDDPLIRQCVSRTLDGGGTWLRVPMLKIAARVGWHGEPARMTLETSRDHGHTWGLYRERDLGEIGQFGRETIFRNLGAYRQVTLRVTVADPVEVSFAAEALL